VSEPRYQFRGERIEDLLRKSGTTVEEADMEETWHELIDDDSETAYLHTDAAFMSLAEDIWSVPTLDPRCRTQHDDALDRLQRHDGCSEVIATLVAQRDDALASLLDARLYCFNDIYVGEYGDLHLTVERFLDTLRPSLPTRGAYQRLDLRQDTCHECEGRDFEHEDWCGAEEKSDRLADARAGLVASHLYCTEAGQALIAHLTKCLEQAEDVAHHARLNTGKVYGDLVVDPHQVLAAFQLDELNVPGEVSTPATLATLVYPPLSDEPYCEPDNGYHHEPHRTCRFLVS
jgi:hypothetical protein